MAGKTLKRCLWAGEDPLYVRYHDEEWGVPVYADAKHFEFLVLEAAQAGLSWLTVLKRRDGYRAAFANFDVNQVALFTEQDQQRLLANAGIIRNRLKIKAAIHNAKVFIAIQKEFGSFNSYIWQFVDGKPVVNRPKTLDELPATSELSDRVSADLKRRGMTFVGSTIMYAHLQATGIIDDHMADCWRSEAIVY